jgi:hypothetical protein
MEIKDGKVNFTKTPTMIKVRAEISKNHRPYFVFLIKEGCDYLRAYLQGRMADGEQLTPNSPIIVVAENTVVHRKLYKKGDFMSRTALSHAIQKAMRRTGTSISKFRAYVFRSYFDTAMLNARMPYELQAFFMGHTGSIERRYTLDKQLPKEQLEEMRKTFVELAEPKLTTIPQVQSSEFERRLDAVKAIYPDKNPEQDAKTIAQQEGIVWDRLPDKDRLKYLSRAVMQFRKPEIKRKQTKQRKVDSRMQVQAKQQGKDPQKIIIEAELEQDLADGWTYVAQLPSGKIIVGKTI